jgi:hypothetical protein
MYDGTEFFDTDEFDSVENPCFVCGEEITAEDWDDRHECHELHCTHETNYELWEEQGCWCDLPAHADCCPGCNKDDE